MSGPTLLSFAAGVSESLADSGAVSRAFARHETFHPRFGWIKKGFDAVTDDPGAFVAEDAPVRLGVGKNMVRAIRYWSRAFKVIEEYPSPDRPRVSHARPTDFGFSLLGETGWDPYLEHPASLWLLHWMLLRPTSEAPTWYFVFNLLPTLGFTENEAVAALASFRNAQPGWEDVADRSLHRDVSCLLRMYVGGERLAKDPDEGIDSPFSDLRLIRVADGDVRHFSFNRGPKASLPDGILVLACTQFLWDTAGAKVRSVALRRLAYDEGSPGRAFRMSPTDIRGALERFDPEGSVMRLADPAGVQQLNLNVDLEELSSMAIASVYQGVPELVTP